MTIKIHYSADQLARGGALMSGPKIPYDPDKELPTWSADTYAVAIAGSPSCDGSFQAVHVHSGEILAEADNAEEIAEYLLEYATTVDLEEAANAQPVTHEPKTVAEMVDSMNRGELIEWIEHLFERAREEREERAAGASMDLISDRELSTEQAHAISAVLMGAFGINVNTVRKGQLQ